MSPLHVDEARLFKRHPVQRSDFWPYPTSFCGCVNAAKGFSTELSHPFDVLLDIDMLSAMDDKEAQRVREFQEAYSEEFGEELTTGEASIRLHQLVELYRLISRPLPPEAPGAGTQS